MLPRENFPQKSATSKIASNKISPLPHPCTPITPPRKVVRPKIVDRQLLIPYHRGKSTLKIYYRGKMPPEKCPRENLPQRNVKLSFRKFKLYLTKFFFEICEIFKNTFLYRTPPVDASGKLQVIFFIKKIKLYLPGIFAAI